MKISKQKGKGLWFKFGEGEEACELLIRPFPHSRMSDADVRVGPDGNATVGLGIEWIRFDACLQGWRGIVDEDTGKEYQYNVLNKKYLYDYDDEVRAFVLDKSADLDVTVEKELKN